MRQVARAHAREQVPEQDRAWLRAKLDEVKQRYRLPVFVIDYRPPVQRSAVSRVVARSTTGAPSSEP